MSASTPDPHLSNNTTTATVTINAVADVSYQAAVVPSSVSSAQSFKINVSVFNAGPDTAFNQ